MIERSVYLAGPITGLTYGEATDWRSAASIWLKARNINAVSPLRGKDFLKDAGVLDGSYEENPLSTARGIMIRDHFDATQCGAVLVNLLGAKKISVGTVMEIAWTFEARVPLIVVMEKEGNPHEHPMINEAISYRVDNLEVGLHVVDTLFKPYASR
jgi:hypothetical protein